MRVLTHDSGLTQDAVTEGWTLNKLHVMKADGDWAVAGRTTLPSSESEALPKLEPSAGATP